MQAREMRTRISVVNDPDVACDMRFQNEDVMSSHGRHLWRRRGSREAQPVRRKVQ
jgi:hypothetical protein